MAEGKKPSVSDVEDWMNEYAWLYSKQYYSLPPTAFRVFLWPTDKYNVKLISGPTAEIHLGIYPGHDIGTLAFNDSMKRAIDRVAKEHLYSTMVVAKVAYYLSQEGRKSWFKEKFGNKSEVIPMLGDEELSIRRVERIEVIHKPTGLREVFEHEQGSTFAARDIAKARLSRRVAEKKAQEGKDNEIPFPASA